MSKAPEKRKPFAAGRGGDRRSQAQGGGSISPQATIIQLLIEDVAYGGAGVGRFEGKVYFVPFTVPGELVRVRPVKQRKHFCEAELVEVVTPSPQRVLPRCPVFGKCGGCAYQHVPYALQLELKTAQVRDLLRRIGKFDSPPVSSTVPSPEQWAYRNRIRVHAERGRVGFYARSGRDLVEVERCDIASKQLNASLSRLRSKGPADGEYTLSVRPGVRYFEQTNDGAAAELGRIVGEMIGGSGGVLVDAYCGAGFFARLLSSRFDQVVGIESHAAAVERAGAEAGPKERYICGDVAEQLGPVLSAVGSTKATVLLDPPAQGISPQVVASLLSANPAQIVYVSCDPATLARDLGKLCEEKYSLERAVPVDMFPQTADVEVVGFLRLGGRA